MRGTPYRRWLIRHNFTDYLRHQARHFRRWPHRRRTRKERVPF